MKQLALAALLALVTTPAFGEAVCGDRAGILAYLASKYREVPVTRGLTGGDASVLEITASPDGATWTALITYPNGSSCVMASGEGFELVPPVPAGDPT